MANKKAKHIIWIVVDSMRSYKSNADDRDYLDVMYKISKTATEFTNVITSAPSSIMSISAMMSSIPAYYIGMNYTDFKYNREVFPSFPSIWKEAGNNFVSFLNARETRLVFKELLNPVGKKYFPPGLNDLKKRWSNEEVNLVLEAHLNQHKIIKPTCFFIWYNIRLDPGSSAQVEYAIRLFKQKNIYENSFFIITADHGYLDPKRGYSPQKLKKMGLTHDILVTEDQIRIPLCIRFPGIPVQRIDNLISSLDLMPTLLDYFGLEYPKQSAFSPYGRSLLDILRNPSLSKNDNTFVRIDGRFMFQQGRITAIRHKNYKYEYHHDYKTEKFYNISKDFYEENNLINQLTNQEAYADFLRMKEFFVESEREAEQIIINILLEKLKLKIASKIKLDCIKRAALICFCEKRYFEHFRKICENIFRNADIDIFEIHPQTSKKKYDVKIAVIDYQHKNRKTEITNILKRIQAKHKFIVDINIEGVDTWASYSPDVILKWLIKQLKLIAESPSLLLHYPKRIKTIIRNIFKAKGNA